MLLKDYWTGRSCMGLSGLHRRKGSKKSWLELQCDGSDNRIAESRRCSAVQGNCCQHRARTRRQAKRVAGLHRRFLRDLKVEGPNSFERSHTLAGVAGDHRPEAIRRLILQLVPTGSS
jgi:hypothetical protein